LDGGGRFVRALSTIKAWLPWTRDASAEDVDSGGLVLPRFLRRPVRLFLRRQWRVPRHIGVKGAVALFLMTAVAGTLIGGHAGTVVSAVTAWSGLAVDQIKITGQSETSELDVLDSLAIGPLPSLVTFDVDAAQARVESLPWVRQATIRKLYPDTLQVSVDERSPYAIWQHDAKNSLIDDSGKVITDVVGERYQTLPMVVGPGANARAGEFIALIAGFPTLKDRVKAGVRIFDRRWNVVFGNGVEVMLPENDPAGALRQVADLDAKSDLLSRDIAALDLRLPDRLVVRLSERGKLARDAMLKAREKAAHRGGANT
jgi:cell division protein FtsQ